MNWEQFKNNLQILIGAVGGYVVGQGWISESVATAIGGVLMFFAPAIWGWVDNRRQALVAKVNAMPEIAGVITKPTEEGKKLADSVPSETVQAAGTLQAVAVARNGEK